MRNFKELKVWQTAHQLTLVVYRLTAHFPDDERFGITSQLRRSAVSIAANIAEGCGRNSERDFARFLSVAAGSASETEYHLLLSRDLGYLSNEDQNRLDTLVNEIKRMLNSFIQKLTAND